MQEQNELKSNLKQFGCQKMCGPDEGHCEKDTRWQPRNGFDGRLMVKMLTTIIQVNLGPNPSETWRRQSKFT